jgi:hypothetical protein
LERDPGIGEIIDKVTLYNQATYEELPLEGSIGFHVFELLLFPLTKGLLIFHHS